MMGDHSEVRRQHKVQRLDPLLNLAEVCFKCNGIKKELLLAMIAEGMFCAPIMFGSEMRWRRQDVDRYLRLMSKTAYRVVLDPGAVSIKKMTALPSDPLAFPEELTEFKEAVQEMPFDRDGFCVYFLIDKTRVVYVGQTKNLAVRVIEHRRGDRLDEPKVFDRVMFMPVEAGKQLETEDYFIRNLRPKYNRNGTKA